MQPTGTKFLIISGTGIADIAETATSATEALERVLSQCAYSTMCPGGDLRDISQQ